MFPLLEFTAVPVVRLHCVCVCSRALSQCGGLPVLEHLNLSGCLFITEVGLQELVSACPSLNDEHFYYCDNINGNTSENVGVLFSIIKIKKILYQ